MTHDHATDKTSSQGGYLVVIGLVFLVILIALAGILLRYATGSAKIVRNSTAQTQALSLAESAIDVAIAKLNENPSYTGETNTALGDGTITISITSVDSQTRTITATGTTNFRGQAVTKTVKANVGINSEVISFRYGVQAGAGGFVMTGGATINGSVYSNGNIDATTGVRITGSATAANPPAINADQVNDSPDPITSCSTNTCRTFGNANGTQDFAQSFRLSAAVPMNNIQLYLKKNGNPSNLTVRIVNDDGGKPSNSQLMSGTIASSTVTSSFGWVTVSMPATPVLSPSETYWMVIDANTNASNNYTIGTNTDSYGSGSVQTGRYGNSWTAASPASLDGYFKIFLGGGSSMIGGNSYNTGVFVGTTGSDEAWADYVKGATVSGPLYCEDSDYTNKACNTSRSSPTPQNMPISDGNIADWKSHAEAGGTHSGDYNVGWAGATLGPLKITGDLTVGGGGTLTVNGTLWVEGDINLAGGGTVRLGSVYGANSGIIVTDGKVTLGGGSSFYGSGTPGSYPFVITTSACPAGPNCDGDNAITLSGGAGTVALIAQNGTAQINGGSSLKAVTAKQISMGGGATLQYDSGLISENFYSGPGGSWQFIPGTYVIME